MDKRTRDTVIAVLTHGSNTIDSAEPHDDYSGRGMMGNTSAAITVHTRFQAEVVVGAAFMLFGVRCSIDALGRGFVVYSVD